MTANKNRLGLLQLSLLLLHNTSLAIPLLDEWHDAGPIATLEHTDTTNMIWSSYPSFAEEDVHQRDSHIFKGITNNNLELSATPCSPVEWDHRSGSFSQINKTCKDPRDNVMPMPTHSNDQLEFLHAQPQLFWDNLASSTAPHMQDIQPAEGVRPRPEHGQHPPESYAQLRHPDDLWRCQGDDSVSALLGHEISGTAALMKENTCPFLPTVLNTQKDAEAQMIHGLHPIGHSATEMSHEDHLPIASHVPNVVDVVSHHSDGTC